MALSAAITRRPPKLTKPPTDGEDSHVSLSNVIIISAMGGAEAGPPQVAAAIALGLGAGALAGALNGLCVAYLRFQPIITTFATLNLFRFVALEIFDDKQLNAVPSTVEGS